MSTGAVFQIIANDGKADKMIMATDLLRQRIEQALQTLEIEIRVAPLGAAICGQMVHFNLAG